MAVQVELSEPGRSPALTAHEVSLGACVLGTSVRRMRTPARPHRLEPVVAEEPNIYYWRHTCQQAWRSDPLGPPAPRVQMGKQWRPTDCRYTHASPGAE